MGCGDWDADIGSQGVLVCETSDRASAPGIWIAEAKGRNYKRGTTEERMVWLAGGKTTGSPNTKIQPQESRAPGEDSSAQAISALPSRRAQAATSSSKAPAPGPSPPRCCGVVSCSYFPILNPRGRTPHGQPQPMRSGGRHVLSDRWAAAPGTGQEQPHRQLAARPAPVCASRGGLLGEAGRGLARGIVGKARRPLPGRIRLRTCGPNRVGRAV